MSCILFATQPDIYPKVRKRPPSPLTTVQVLDTPSVEAPGLRAWLSLRCEGELVQKLQKLTKRMPHPR